MIAQISTLLLARVPLALLLLSGAFISVPAQPTLRGDIRSRDLQSTTSIIITLQLIDVSTKTIVVARLSEGDRINIRGLGPLNLQAIVNGTTTSPSITKSVTFGYNGNPTFRTESIAPYTFCGDFGGTFYACSEFQVGTHTVTATPFSQPGGKGIAGPMTNVTFTLTDGFTATTAPIKSPTLTPTTSAPVISTTLAPTVQPTLVPVTPAPVVSSPTTNTPVVATTEAPVKSHTINPEAPVSSPTHVPTTHVVIVVPTTEPPVIGTEAPVISPTAATETPGVVPTPVAAPTPTPSVPPVTALPTHIPVAAPTQPPITTTTKPTVIIPTPVALLTQIPTKASSLAPTPAPTKAPTLAPTKAPTLAPTMAPIKAPTPAPTPAPNCKVPKFVGNWLPTTKYPIPAAEAQGSMIGDDFVIISGFTMGYGQATAQNYALNLRSPNATWRLLDNLPVSQGITHGAFCVVGMKLYMCGGYLGGHPGPHIATCLVYDHSIPPGSNKQWSFLPSLPQGRAGGGMVYDPHRHALIFAGGAERPKPGNPNAIDYQHAWIFEFSGDGGGVWRALPDIPFLSNHMSYVTTTDGLGRTRHYFFGGQIGENEFTGNIDSNYEWDSTNATWIQRSKLPFARGHASSSTTAVPCGYLLAGGSTNQLGKTKDISYYNIATDSWTKLGDLPSAVNTPVCGIDFVGGMYYCETAWANGKFSTRRKIEV